QSLTTCEVCGACFETRKGLSSHARSHLRQLGVAESESSGAPIDLLYELVRHKGKADGAPSALVPPLAKKSSGSPKEPGAAPRPALLALAKAERPPEGAVNKAIKSPPGFAKALAQPGSPVLKKVPPALGGSPSPKNPEEKSSKLALSPLPGSPTAQWPQDEDGPLNLTSGSEPARDIRCEFCGEFFENRKGLSSHARSHLRQMGVTEWYVNGSPIDTLREILKRRRGGNPNPAGNPAGPKAVAKSLLGTLGPLEPRGPAELHIPALGKKKKLKPEQLRVEIKRELMAGGIHGEPHPSDRAWSPREEMSPLNLSSRADPVRDIRCEFCGEFFENRKGLSSHARSHLRQMGVTEWSVNGSPIDTLREILRKKSKPCLIKKEPLAPGLEPPKALGEDGLDPKPPAVPAGKVLPGLALSPLGGRPGKPGGALALTPLGAKNPGAFLAPKRPLPDDRLGPHGESKHKAFGPPELPFKAKALHDKASSEVCCEPVPYPMSHITPIILQPPRHPLTRRLRRFCEVEFQGPLSIQEEWVRHLQRHILDMNFSKADPLRSEAPAPPEPPALAEAQ
ncbi:PREDICTED: protein Wiz, partial [Lepidothrix coronata]|uniref:Protein Wiz n=1 Tax=Lepidothrix coronata TaxID=321398 RepID=A0A6J0J8C2_9PASS